MAGYEGTRRNVAGAELRGILAEIDAVLHLPR